MPRVKDITPEQYVDVAIKVFEENITPIKAKIKEPSKELNKNKLLELTGMELHLGKMSWSGETGQDYDKNNQRNHNPRLIIQKHP